MTSDEGADVTVILEAIESGETDAANRLFELVYEELRTLAAKQMRRERISVTLQSTALVHEAWIKLLGNRGETNWRSRGYFFAAASRAMRQVLVDAARNRMREKRGGISEKLEFREDDWVSREDEDVVALHEALVDFEELDAVKAELVNLRYFGGFTNKQAAEHLGISTATAERYWTFARAWLRARLEA